MREKKATYNEKEKVREEDIRGLKGRTYGDMEKGGIERWGRLREEVGR